MPVKLLTRVLALGLAFVAGVLAGGSAGFLYFERAAEAKLVQAAHDQANEAQMVCGQHQAALCQRAGLYHQKYGRWPANVRELVAAHFLPEYSQLHLCYLQIPAGGLITRMTRRGRSLSRRIIARLAIMSCRPAGLDLTALISQ